MTDFPYRLAAVDLDDTLLGPDKKIGIANRAALAALQKRGVRIVLASGRRHENMLRFHKELKLDGLVISSQGALVKHAETEEVLHQHVIPGPVAAEVVAAGEALGMSALVYRLDKNYVRCRTYYMDVYEQRTASGTFRVSRWESLLDDGVLKILWLGKAAKVSEELPLVRERWGEHLEALVTDPEYLEFMAAGVSKAVGAEVASRHYGVPREQVVAFGDGNNDASMLAWAGLGVAMSHSRPSAKAAADRVAPPGNAESDFARAVGTLLSGAWG